MLTRESLANITQIARTIKGYDQVAAIFGLSDNAQELRDYLRRGKKIIVTTVQKFPFILDELGGIEGKSFALLIDGAHSSQGGRTWGDGWGRIGQWG